MILYVMLTVRRVFIIYRHSPPQLPARGVAVFLCLPARPFPLSAEDGLRSPGVMVHGSYHVRTQPRPRDHASMLLAYGAWSTVHS